MILLLILATLLLTAGYHCVKPLPQGLAFAGPFHPATDASFLRDLTWTDARQQQDQQIFDMILHLIQHAETLLVLDMFLFNDYLGTSGHASRALSGEITDTLVNRMQKNPALQCWLITDPINTVYGGKASAHLDRLRQHGVTIVETRLDRLRDSNPAYSVWWRLLLRHWPHRWGPGLPNPFGRGKVTLRSYLDLLNFKANHRKTVIGDPQGQLVALVTSANPHDGSSAHHNVALRFTGAAAHDLLATEAAVCRFSGAEAPSVPFPPPEEAPSEGPVVRVLTERAIETAARQLIRQTKPEDQLYLAMFYLSSRPVVRALKQAAQRGVKVHVLLDANKDAFGREKNGIPNRPVAAELVRAGIAVRWAQTRGEQFHTKLLWHVTPCGNADLLLGSANYTRRNLRNLNLETCVQLRGNLHMPVCQAVQTYLDLIWQNSPERKISTAYETYADDSRMRKWLYHVQEATGLSTF